MSNRTTLKRLEQLAQRHHSQPDDAQRRERECRHDVMSHVYAYGLQCPSAKGIIHLGATSAYVGDNTDLIQMQQGLVYVRRRLCRVLEKLSGFALQYKDVPQLGFTHFQAAQLMLLAFIQVCHSSA